MENEIGGNIILQATSASFFAKILVDALKKYPTPIPAWVNLVFAFAFSEICAFLLSITMRMTLDGATIAGNILVGVVAFGVAIGVTQLQRSGDATQEKAREDAKQI